MLSECAVSPETFARLRDRDELKTFLSIFAYDRVSRPCGIPTKATWIEQVKEELKKACPDSLPARQCMPDLIERLKRLAIERTPGPVVDSRTPWLSAALSTDAEKPLHCVVSTSRNASPAPRVKSKDEFFDEHRERPASFEVKRDPDALSKVLGSFFQWSEKIVIVDPYGIPSVDNSRQGLSATLRCLLQRATRHRPAELLIVCEPRSDGSSPPLAQLKCAANKELKALAPLGVVRTWRFVVRKVDFKWAMHDRYVLTNIGGVASGAGFDRGRGKTMILLLDEENLFKKLREFGPELRRYAKYEDVVVSDP